MIIGKESLTDRQTDRQTDDLFDAYYGGQVTLLENI